MTDPQTLLEEIELTRERGYSTDNEEFMDGMVAIAVPIHDNHGRLMSTLSVHAPTQRVTLSDLEQHLELFRQAAADLSELVLR
jgi:DNA-binding IclR family transcriptional regulator